jgi:hypothetical protein
LWDDLHNQVRASVAWASLEGVSRRQQAPVAITDGQFDMDISVWLVPHAINPAGDSDAPLLDFQTVGQVDPVEGIARSALPGPEPLQVVMTTAELERQMAAVTQREGEDDRGRA